MLSIMQKSIKLPNRIFDVGLSPAALLVFAAMRALDRNCDDYIIARSQDIAVLCGLHRNTVAKAITELQAHKLIRKVNRFTDKGYKAANGYYIASVSRKYFLLPLNIFSYCLSPSVFCTYCFLTCCKNHANRAYPSLRKIAVHTGLCIDTVISSLDTLSVLKLLSKSRYITCECDYGCNNYFLAQIIIRKIKGFIKRKIARATANSRASANKYILKVIFIILLLKIPFVKLFLFSDIPINRRVLFFRLGVLEKMCNLY